MSPRFAPGRHTPALAAALTVVAGLLIALVGCGKKPSTAPDQPAGAPAPPVLDGTPPTEVTFAADKPELGDESDRPTLNDFSWRDFVALNWPAADGPRGVADATKKFGDQAERVVWESWKSLGELFPEDPIAIPPAKWDSYKTALRVRWRDGDTKGHYAITDRLPEDEAGKVKLLQQFARLEDVGQPVFPGVPGSPLIAQNKTYVRFETRVNKVAYEFMVEKKYYLRAEQPAMFEFPEGSINVKAAWMELPADEAVRKRFYRTTARVVTDWAAGTPPTPVVEDRVVGLVGLHIVHKTPGRRDWVWSTFEHVDNLLPEHGPGTPPASFSSQDPAPATGANAPPTSLGTRKPFPPLAARTPVEVVRVNENKIHSDTKDVNRRYQQHPQVKGTVWENYQLVGTQWPKLGQRTRTNDGGDPANRLPKHLANSTMETFTSVNISCLSCHATAVNRTFVFYPQVRAFPLP